MTDASRYIKIVAWSDEDGAFIGHCPGIIGPCCHGLDEVEVYRQLCEIVEEWIELALQRRAAASPSHGRKGGGKDRQRLERTGLQVAFIDKPKAQAKDYYIYI